MNQPITTIAIEQETDVVAVRQRARQIAGLLGFEHQDQARIATAISEIARNAFSYGGGGTADFLLDDASTPQAFIMRISDTGPGIAHLEAVLQGSYRSAHGMGIGIIGARLLMDTFTIEQGPGQGTTVIMAKRLPRRQTIVTPAGLSEIAKTLGHQALPDHLTEMREQNRELIRSLDEERVRQEELTYLNNELQDTNRGVVALYAELDEKAEQLRQASELKSRFLSNMTHEFRTPLNSILALAELLLDETDGTLQPEQARQIDYIRKSAHSLTELVNDLLDIAKVEAGKLDVRATKFSIGELFGALRGALRPLCTGDAVELIFEPPVGIDKLFTDEAKLSQILRNLISNALKFTLAGEVRLTCQRGPQNDIIFTVRDTGIGIDAADHEAIFQEFAQVHNALQTRVKGTGLGLSLSRKLAELLGGSLSVASAPNAGSAFQLSLPAAIAAPDPAPATATATALPNAIKRVLVIDDEETFRYVLRQMIGESYEIFDAQNGLEGLEQARQLRPDVIFLDLQMPILDGYAALKILKSDPATQNIKIFVVTSSVIGHADTQRLHQADSILSKKTLSRIVMASMLKTKKAYAHD